MKSFKQPTQHQIDAAIQRIRAPEFEAYFFSRLENPEWVVILKKKGLFSISPPTAHWPASKFLVRMAKEVPSQVASIYSDLDTNNLTVIGDMIDAALQMPAKIAATLIHKICKAMNDNALWVHFKEASDLCEKLAEGDELDGAMTLAKTLYSPKIERGEDEPNKLLEHRYKDGLKKLLPVLIQKGPPSFLSNLCDWLKICVAAKKGTSKKSGSDYSYVWRPAVEKHGQNRDYDFAGAMVGFAREGFEQVIQQQKLSLEEALKILSGYEYLIFQRIEIHLTNAFAEKNSELARKVMMDRDLFNNSYFKHEYAMLMGNRMNLLQPEEKEEWFGWLNAGPPDLDEALKKTLGRDPTEEDRNNRKYYWQFEKMHWVTKYLEGEQKQFYEDMLKQHGIPKMADLNFRIDSGWRGNISPMNVGELSKLTFEQVVEKMSAWRPDESTFMGPSIEGLASTFEEYVKGAAETFSSQANVLVNQPAIYVRGFIKQMSEAVKNNRKIDVLPVLKLSQWVVNQPLKAKTILGNIDEADVDKDWQWTRDATSQLVENICTVVVDDKLSFPISDFREPLWELISGLCKGPAESYVVHDKTKDDPRTRDYLNLSINSSRGKAVEAGLEYARWVAKQINKAADGGVHNYLKSFKFIFFEQNNAFLARPNNSSF